MLKFEIKEREELKLITVYHKNSTSQSGPQSDREPEDVRGWKSGRRKFLSSNKFRKHWIRRCLNYLFICSRFSQIPQHVNVTILRRAYSTQTLADLLNHSHFWKGIS